jgi:hypothetical protein
MRFRERQDSKRAEDVKVRIGRVLELMDQEDRAAEQWLKQLDALYERTSQALIDEQKQRFAAESREYLKTEIRKLFAKYDVLARPRRFVKEILLTPFRLLGLREQKAATSHKEALLQVRQRIDLTPVQLVIEKFNRLVLERLSPKEEKAPLFHELRRPGLELSDQEIKERIWDKQDQLATWLEETFQKLSRGIPRGKQWGIYSTSILWGILILTFEATLGGGFTLIDVALDSALAPFVTKGAAELFAYHEIQNVARELAQRYQDGLVAVVREQRDRYEHCLQSLMVQRETLEFLRTFRARIGAAAEAGEG